MRRFCFYSCQNLGGDGVIAHAPSNPSLPLVPTALLLNQLLPVNKAQPDKTQALNDMQVSQHFSVKSFFAIPRKEQRSHAEMIFSWVSWWTFLANCTGSFENIFRGFQRNQNCCLYLFCSHPCSHDFGYEVSTLGIQVQADICLKAISFKGKFYVF